MVWEDGGTYFSSEGLGRTPGVSAIGDRRGTPQHNFLEPHNHNGVEHRLTSGKKEEWIHPRFFPRWWNIPHNLASVPVPVVELHSFLIYAIT